MNEITAAIKIGDFEIIYYNVKRGFRLIWAHEPVAGFDGFWIAAKDIEEFITKIFNGG